ncbi:uncharacterized protein [Haliotis asinina]|uniref:uncharacterized protein n=1 Tax=Haliotis asinina TaxID=109174 RepID=UPI003531B442
MASWMRIGLTLTLLVICGIYTYWTVWLKLDATSSATNRFLPPQIIPAEMQVAFNKDTNFLKILSQRYKDLSFLQPEVTVITAYFNIGSFAKGSISNMYTPNLYMNWMKVFGRIRNNLAAYTDSKDVFDLLTSLRRRFPSNMTKIFLIKRADLWSFSLAKEIRNIYSQPNYPRHYPNTVNENYSCAMHAKFELVNRVLVEELFPTKYFCWLDIGLFRGLVDDTSTFKLQIPNEWDKRKVAYSIVYGFNDKETTENIIKGNQVWVGGAMFLGTPQVLYNYTEDYMNTVKMLLRRHLMNTDQQVIYSMYLPSSAYKPRVQIQLFSQTESRYDPWFYLGYLCRETWQNSQHDSQT